MFQTSFPLLYNLLTSQSCTPLIFKILQEYPSSPRFTFLLTEEKSATSRVIDNMFRREAKNFHDAGELFDLILAGE